MEELQTDKEAFYEADSNVEKEEEVSDEKDI
jgi:hypothetical protein